MRWISDLSRRNSLRGNENVQSPTRKTLPLDEMPMQCSTARTINNLSMETGPLPRIKRLPDQDDDNPRTDEQTPPLNGHGSASSIERIKKIFMFFEPKGCLKERDDYSLYLFPPNNRYVVCVSKVSRPIRNITHTLYIFYFFYIYFNITLYVF